MLAALKSYVALIALRPIHYCQLTSYHISTLKVKPFEVLESNELLVSDTI